MKSGWQLKRLADVAKVSAGNSAPQDESLFKDGVYPFFRTADAGRVRFGEIHKSADYLNDKGIKGLRRYPSGTILFPKSGASTFLNHRVMLGVEGFVSSHLATIVADTTQIEPRFLLYFLSTVAAQDLIQDHAYPSLNLPTIEGISIQSPPLHEQKRIVDILDEAFAVIATAKANAEKNLQNARALFESHLNNVFTKRGEGWVEKTIKEITSLLGDGLHGTPKYTDGGEYYFINGNNLEDGKIVFKENTKRVSSAEYEKHKKKLNDRTVLVSINGTLGNVAFYNNEKIILGKSACYFNLLDSVDKHFIKYIISSPYFLQYAHREATGATIKNVSLKSMREFKVLLPSLTEQNAIVSKLDNLSKETQRLESIYQQKLEALEELKKSLLHQTFTGNL
jgi:type I restriction enzyme, S subunit